MQCYRPRGVNVLVCMCVYVYVRVKYKTECLITCLWGVFLTLFLAWNALWQLKTIVHILLYSQDRAVARLWYTNEHSVYGCSDFSSQCLAAFINNLTIKTIFDLFSWLVWQSKVCGTNNSKFHCSPLDQLTLLQIWIQQSEWNDLIMLDS